MKDQLTPRQVARAIGVSEASLKRWCDKGLIPSVRTPGGHRRLLLSDVVAFLRESGHPLPNPEVLGLPSAVGKGRLVLERARREMTAALADGDDERLRGLATSLYLAGHPLVEICDELLAPAFAALGERWQHGEVAVYQERRGCEITTRILHELRRALPAPRPDAPLAIGGTLAGDPYTLPNAMVELVLLEEGWRTVNCGCGLPAETFVAAVRAFGPRLVWLSVSSEAAAAVAAACAPELAAALNETGAALVIGGRAAPVEAAAALPSAATAGNLLELADHARRLDGRHGGGGPWPGTGSSSSAAVSAG